jgi:hypothetical protein
MSKEDAPTDAQVAQVLEEALALMNNSGAHWTKGQFSMKVGDETLYCAIGGIRAAAPGADKQTLRDRAVVALASNLHITPKPKLPHYARREIISWNDRRLTEWPDVKRIFTKAAKKLRSG